MHSIAGIYLRRLKRKKKLIILVCWMLKHQRRCFRKLLGISYKDHITNEEVNARIENAIGPYGDLTSVKRHKLMWYGHVTRSSGLAKTILQGTVQGGRRRENNGKTTSKSGLALNGIYYGKLRTARSGGSWL